MNRDQLFAAIESASSEPPRLVKIPRFGEVHIRELTVGDVDEQIAERRAVERDEAEAAKEGRTLTVDQRRKRSLARGACRLLCDENGNQLADPNNPEHVAKMEKLPWRVLNAIDAASELPADKPGN